ncbi:YafY family transcriptional regulator [Puniceicoccaceae bacterium K14]|nr:YafY family transcriptional regulator [Puniceicoccaceae bacterium K14]
MNRIDRLTSMILMLQSHRVVTAEKISEYFEISVRTVYRDIAALGEAGVPIVAEAGVGYSLVKGYNVPPIMFTQEEVAALFMSGELTEKFGDESLKKSLSGALLKVRSALPDGHKDYLRQLGARLEVWSRPNMRQSSGALMAIQEAVVERRCVTILYDKGSRGEVSERTVEALGLTFYGQQWHLIAWCRMRKAMRDFRLDRINSCEVLQETFSGHDDFSLDDFVNCISEESRQYAITIECEPWALERISQHSPCRIVYQENLSSGWLLLNSETYSLEWMARWLIGLGRSVIVREPEELQVLISQEAEKVLEHYRQFV